MCLYLGCFRTVTTSTINVNIKEWGIDPQDNIFIFKLRSYNYIRHAVVLLAEKKDVGNGKYVKLSIYKNFAKLLYYNGYIKNTTYGGSSYELTPNFNDYWFSWRDMVYQYGKGYSWGVNERMSIKMSLNEHVPVNYIFVNGQNLEWQLWMGESI